MKESERERVSEKDVGSIYFFFFRFSMEMSKKKRKVALVNLPNCNLPPPLYLQA